MLLSISGRIPIGHLRSDYCRKSPVRIRLVRADRITTVDDRRFTVYRLLSNSGRIPIGHLRSDYCRKSPVGIRLVRTDWITTVDDRRSTVYKLRSYSGRIPTNCTVGILSESDRFGRLGIKKWYRYKKYILTQGSFLLGILIINLNC